MDGSLFPVFLKLAGRRVVVVGGGPVAASKIPPLVEAGADVTVIAPEIVESIGKLAVRVERRPFRPDDLEGAWFVVAAAPPAVNREVSAAADERCVFVNAVDDPPSATAYLGGVFRRAGVTFAISTDGHAPALAGLLREGLELTVPDDLDRWIAEARAIRREWIATGLPMTERRPRLLDALNGLYAARRGANAVAPEVVS